MLLLKDNVDEINQKRNVKTVLPNANLLVAPQQTLTQHAQTTDYQTPQGEYHQMVVCTIGLKIHTILYTEFKPLQAKDNISLDRAPTRGLQMPSAANVSPAMRRE